MGLFISNLARTARTLLGESVRNTIEFFGELLLGTHVPPTGRRLSLRNADYNFNVTAKSHPIEIICCEQGTECKLYISIYNQQNENVLESTIYQDTATSAESEIEVLWTNPRSGVPDGITFSYPVEAKTIKDMFM